MVAMFYKGLDSDQKTVKEVSFSKFAQMVEQEKFEAVQIENTTLTGQLDKDTYYYALEPPAESSDDRRAGLPVLHYDESGRQRQGVPVRQIARQDG